MLAAEWEKFSLEIYGKHERGPVLDAHRAFYRGVLAALLSWTPKMRQVAKVEPCP
jgi:hypothetical protein